MYSNLAGWHVLGIVLYLVILALVVLGLYFVIRLAVRHALRDHEKERRSRELPPDA